MSRKQLKVHCFSDCTNIPYMYRDGKYQLSDLVQISDNIYNVTCGQCKGRILNRIKDRDWSTLPMMEIAVLLRYMNLIRYTK